MLGVPGIVTSSSTIRGRSSAAISIASSASPASATTSRSSSASRIRRSPPRTSAWSSASTTLIGTSASSADTITAADSKPAAPPPLARRLTVSRECRCARSGSDVSGARAIRPDTRREESTVKYVILIHSNPQPWGHPTGDYVAEFQALPKQQRDAMMADFKALLGELSEQGELIGGEALADPAGSRLYRWESGKPLATDGPYSEAKEHLAGFFLIDVDSHERAEELAAKFAGPGDTVELRPTMWPGGDDQ